MRDLRVSAMPGCCGMKVIHDFGHTPSTGGRIDYASKRELKEGLMAVLDNQFTRPKSIILVALNEDQAIRNGDSNIPEEILLEEGFVLVGEGYYSGHGRMNYLYIKEKERNPG